MTVATPEITRPAIAAEQRNTIIATMRRTGKWTGRRAGRRVCLWRKQTAEGVRIGYQVQLRRSTVCHGTAPSVADAIDVCNEILQPRPPKLSAPEIVAESNRMANEVTARNRQISLALLDAERTKTAVRPFEQLKLREPERLPYKD